MPLNGCQRAALPFRSVNRRDRPGHAQGLQRHHLLPLQMLGHRALGRMIGALGETTIGFHDFRRNGLLLPSIEEVASRIGLPLHRGPHNQYNEMVLDRAGIIEAGWVRQRARMSLTADLDALFRFDLLQRALRRRLLDPGRGQRAALRRHDPALDFSHLDRMAESLWGSVQPE